VQKLTFYSKSPAASVNLGIVVMHDITHQTKKLLTRGYNKITINIIIYKLFLLNLFTGKLISDVLAYTGSYCRILDNHYNIERHP
jgi:hypothetical protein